MARILSFSMTMPQFLNGTKTVTRRMGWETAKVGDILKAVEKAMGLKKGQSQHVLGHIRLVDVRREPLNRLLAGNGDYGRRECVLEGFPSLTPTEFIDFFCRSHTGCFPEREITRLEFERLDRAAARAESPKIYGAKEYPL